PKTVAGGDGGDGADDLRVLADDRVPAGESAARRERAEPARGLVEPSSAPLEEEQWRPPEAVSACDEPLGVAVERAAGASFEPGPRPAELLEQLAEIRHHEPGGDAGSRCSY